MEEEKRAASQVGLVEGQKLNNFTTFYCFFSRYRMRNCSLWSFTSLSRWAHQRCRAARFFVFFFIHRIVFRLQSHLRCCLNKLICVDYVDVVGEISRGINLSLVREKCVVGDQIDTVETLEMIKLWRTAISITEYEVGINLMALNMAKLLN